MLQVIVSLIDEVVVNFIVWLTSFISLFGSFHPCCEASSFGSSHPCGNFYHL